MRLSNLVGHVKFFGLVLFVWGWLLLVVGTVARGQSPNATDSIYQIRTPDGAAGTAFVVATNRETSILATASHVTQYRDSKTTMYLGNAYAIADPSGKDVTKATCIAMDVEVDIALVKTDKPVEGAPFEIIEDVDKYVFGRPNVTPGPDYYPKKLLVRIRGYADGFKETVGFYSFTYKDTVYTDATGIPGQSGGPMLLDDKVVGVLSGGHEWFTYKKGEENRSATWPAKGGSGRRLKEMLRSHVK